MMAATTDGGELAATPRRYFHVGPRTRRYRADKWGRSDLHREMCEAVMYAAQCPGYYSEATEAALRPGFGTALSYGKHVMGCRIDGTLACHINSLSAWQFSALLVQMVDAGVTCTGDGERFFAEMARKVQQAA
jgi:hypothetical protein